MISLWSFSKPFQKAPKVFKKWSKPDSDLLDFLVLNWNSWKIQWKRPSGPLRSFWKVNFVFRYIKICFKITYEKILKKFWAGLQNLSKTGQKIRSKGQRFKQFPFGTFLKKLKTFEKVLGRILGTFKMFVIP